MDKKAVLKIISDFKKIIESRGIKIERLILFGSYATNKYNEWSDIDVVVVSNDFENKSYWERIDVLSAAIYEVFAPIEAVAMTPEEWKNKDSMIIDYAKNGEVII
jgi:uncharacterized protein